jgi:hypothetical protein
VSANERPLPCWEGARCLVAGQRAPWRPMNRTVRLHLKSIRPERPDPDARAFAGGGTRPTQQSVSPSLRVDRRYSRSLAAEHSGRLGLRPVACSRACRAVS